MILLFPGYPGNSNKPDPSFEEEVVEARKLGFKIGFVDVEIMFGGELSVHLPESNDTQAIYRGWILKQTVYQQLFEKLQSNGILLINSPEEYYFAQNIPSWYPILQGMTPETVWIPGEAFKEQDIHEALKRFGSEPVLLKDYIKSRKQNWHDACFIRDASDQKEVMRVVDNFLQLQGNAFEGGLVFRRFEALDQIGTHPKSKMPLVNEWRQFVLNDQTIASIPYWDDAEYSNDRPDIRLPKIPVRFYTVDIARKATGEWIVIEIGDGGCSGIPKQMTPVEFYKNLSGAVSP